MNNNISAAHKKILVEALSIKKSIDEKDALKEELQEKVKNNAMQAVKDLKEIKYHLKVMKDIAGLFLGNE